MDEVLALEEQRLAGRLRQRIGKAVADVEPGGMAAAAVAAEGVDGDLGMPGRDADDIEAAIAQQQLEVRATPLPLATLDDEGKLDPGHRRDQPHRRRAQRSREALGVRLAQQDRHQRRAIDDHSAPQARFVVADDLVGPTVIEVRQGGEGA